TSVAEVSQEDDVLVGTLELPREVRDIETSQEEALLLERAARSSILARAHAPSTPPSGHTSSACFDLRAVFRSLGATDQPEVLRMADLQTALARVSQEMFTSAGGSTARKETTSSKGDHNKVAAAAAANITARLAGNGGERRTDGLDYGRFEDWLLPPRRFTVLRDVLTELVEEGSALGLTARELFDQFGGSGNSSRATGGASEGVGSRDLRAGLGSLNIHLTETEVERVMAGAGCVGSDKGAESRLTFEMFSALVSHPRRRPKQRLLPAASAESEGKRGDYSANAAIALDTQASPEEPGRQTPAPRQGNNNSSLADDGSVTPDSLSRRMTLSELVGVGEPWAGGPGPGTASSSAAAHAEAFGRVAADVQAVLTTAVASGTGCDGDGGSGSSNSKRQGQLNNRGSGPNSGGSGSVPSPAKLRFAAAEVIKEEKRTGEVTPTPTRLSASDSGPVPRTGAITPPLGPVRSPSEPHHPTRASRERLKAALEDLDLKERLRPTVGGDQHAGLRGVYDSAGELLLPASREEGPGLAQKGTPLTNRSSAAEATAAAGAAAAAAAAAEVGSQRASSSGRRRPANTVATGTTSDVLRRSSAGGGARENGGDRRATSVRARTAGGLRSHRDNPFSSGRGKDGGGSGRDNGARLEQRRLGKDVEEANFLGDAAHLGESRDAPEVIGRLRAKVAELELTGQLLRCELEGARVDLAAKGRRAEEEAQKAEKRAKEREHGLQARMAARLRAAEAEIAATAKSIADFKRNSAAEAAAREKSSAEYLRRRLKEAEAALQAKAARRTLLKSGLRKESLREKSGADSGGGDAGSGGNADGGSVRWAQRTRKKVGGRALGEADANSGETVAAARLREELRACRRKLAVANAEACRLKNKAAAAA
ncbi:unnamed protein product, partial [Laminaria digitata]